MSGKGSRRRPENAKKVARGWAEINWKSRRRQPIKTARGVRDADECGANYEVR